MTHESETNIRLCDSRELEDSGKAVSFDVQYRGEFCRAFAVRFDGQVYAYLNRCTHVAMELDWMPDRFFDESGRWLICGAHGAMYAPDSGDGVAGPCCGPLTRIQVHEREGVVYWRTTEHLQAVEF